MQTKYEAIPSKVRLSKNYVNLVPNDVDSMVSELKISIFRGKFTKPNYNIYS